MKGLVVKTTGLWFEVYAEGERRICRLRGKFKQENKKITNPIAVGDWVEMEPLEQSDEWVATHIFPRENYVLRQSPRKKGHDHIIASNIDQALIFFTFKLPRTSIGFVDRVLVTLESFRIPAMVYLNKTDVYDPKQMEVWNQLKTVYQSLGYECLQGSLIGNGQKDFPIDQLKDKATLLVGHSGTGKSTLINEFVPGASQEIGEISSFANKGTHTTTFAEMFISDENTRLIDTPGIKELGLSDMEPYEIAHYFPEMRKYLGECKFHNCLHAEEPGCLIKEKVEAGEIAFFRYESYLSMIFSEDNRR